jgi:hypothetical protein
MLMPKMVLRRSGITEKFRNIVMNSRTNLRTV